MTSLVYFLRANNFIYIFAFNESINMKFDILKILNLIYGRLLIIKRILIFPIFEIR